MTGEEYRRAGRLFDEIRELPDEQRAAALDAASGNNAELRAQVLRLLDADRDASGRLFMENPAIEDAARLLERNGTPLPASGTVFGNYSLGPRIGEGGMGVVYEGQDLRLHRRVAIKILTLPFAAEGKERIKRFQQEARAASLLNHPNIVSILDADFDQGYYYIAMEFVEGKTLRQLIASDSTVLDSKTILDLIAQTASALNAAHEAGIVHRDIKPENIMVRPDGFVKVLDFGLAKRRERAGQAETGASELRTRPGHLAGTLQYLSPEQVAGKPVDGRSDVFSLGVVAYELFTRARPFDGPTDGAIFDAILNRPPAIPSSVRAALSSDFDVLILQALEKDPELRYQTAGELRSSCKRLTRDPVSRSSTISATPLVRKQAVRRNWIPWTVAAVLAVFSAQLTYLQFRSHSPANPVIHFPVTLPANILLAPYTVPLVSPDGEKIAFSASSTGNADDASIWIYRMATGDARQLTSTEKVVIDDWSPDGNFLAIRRGSNVSKIEINSGGISPLLEENRAGTPPTIRDAVETGGSNLGARSVAWGPGGMLLRAPSDNGLIHVGDDGNRRPAAKPGNDQLYPVQILPDGRQFLFEADLSKEGAAAELWRGSLAGGETTRLMPMDGPVYYSPPGYLLFLKLGTLMAQPFDAKRSLLQGQPIPLINGVAHLRRYMYGAFSVSQQGVLAYRPGATAENTHLTWFNRSGKVLGTVGGMADYTNPAFSPDEKRLAVGVRDPQTSKREIWIFDLARGSSSRLTFGPKDDFNPVWSPDGSRIAFTSDRNGVRDLFVKSTGAGEDELLLSGKGDKNAEQWSPDGRYLLYNYLNEHNGRDLRLLRMSGEVRTPDVYLAPSYRIDQSRFSPDGRWVAYRSLETGMGEVYVQPFPISGQKWQISGEGGSEPQWRGDGRELFYYSGSSLMAVSVNAKGNMLETGPPRRLFDVRLAANSRNRWLVSKDGQRILAAVLEEDQKTPFHVVVNWPEMLRK